MRVQLKAKYDRTFKDDKQLPDVHNGRGTVAFITDHPDSRTTQIAISTGDNSAEFDANPWMTPFATVVEGMDVLERLSYGQGIGGEAEPDPLKLEQDGHHYLLKVRVCGTVCVGEGLTPDDGDSIFPQTFPRMSFIKAAKTIGWSR
eukprot:SAG11_NODE_184_length_13162_cov_9.151803_6_plen_146_part_00